MPRKRFADHESFRRIAAEIRADTERRMAATPPRPGRATVPYTEPGPTTHDNVTLLEGEAEEAYELLWRARARIQAMQNTLAVAYGTRDAMAEACLADIECHIQKHGERYRKQGGGR